MTGGYKVVRNNPVLLFLDRGERVILCGLLAGLIVLACLQIVLRAFFNSGLLWADSFIRYLVIWCGLLGAVSATGQGNHIALDITGNTIPRGLLPWITLVTHLFCSLAAAGLTWAGWRFLQGEIKFGGHGPLSLPLWFWNSIFPAAFGLISIKYTLLFFLQLTDLLGLTPKRPATKT